MSIEMKIPLDNEGFLQRECPNCEQQFRLKPFEDTTEGDAETEFYYCPYCYKSSSTDSWWTKEQLEYAQKLAFQQVVEPELRNLQHQIRSLNSDFIKVDVKSSQVTDSELPNTSDYMVKVEFPCHPETPLKIDKVGVQNIVCLICGIQYPIELVEEL